LHIEPAPIAGQPVGGPFVFVWGTGAYRKNDPYLSIVPAAQFESGKGTQYFVGLGASGTPIWSEKESHAKAIVENGTMGDLSVTWCKDLGLWLMTYDSRDPAPRGILFSYSRTPWGPWSEPQIIFNAMRDGALGKFIHNPQANPDDGLAGPVIGKGQANPQAVHGGAYAPYVRAMDEGARFRAKHLLRAVCLESIRCRADEVAVVLSAALRIAAALRSLDFGIVDRCPLGPVE
jgi:hypothetical protein